MAAEGRRRHEAELTATPGDWAAARSLLERAIGFLFLAVIVAGIAVAVFGVAVGGWQVQPILSGSMRPGFPVGGVVVAERMPMADLQVRDVAIFHPPSDPGIDYVHRVISLRREGTTVIVQTQGDANLYPDPWTLRLRGRYVYVARFTLPLLGYPAVWVHSPTGRRTMLTLALVLAGALVALLLRDRRLRRRAGVQARGAPTTRPETSEDDVPAGDGLDSG